VLGLTVGAGTVVGRHAIDSSLRTVDEAESYLELPALASVPKKRSSARSGFEQAEAFRTLRASISLLRKESEYRSFLFTSAIPAEGKTFTCVNLGLSLAQQGLSTVVIDADLREPRLRENLLPETDDVPGLADLLSGQTPLKHTLKPTNHDNLVVLPAGRTAPDPAQLLAGKEFSRLLEHLLGEFDRVIIDSPPVNAVSDVLLIAEHAQATLLVVRAGKTPRKAVLRAICQLEMARARIAGFVFNRLPVGGRSAGYYYYYYGNRYSQNGAHKESKSYSSS
jgi:polysaccharide biosynthesis transport protein